MASILPGYQYDIFISYRHNDNRTGWVSDFVRALQNEIAATIKEPLSVYFDTNPHDGLLETHDVDGSLKEKIKCLVFISIVSQTYCDPKSFAWQNEFLPFLDFVKRDEFGLDIMLANGNVSKRVLPVLIHEIDKQDQDLFESKLGSVMRPLKFIYKEAGVNRPLLPDDTQASNIHGISYRNQVNKVANYLRELISGITTTVNPNNIVSSPATQFYTKPEKKSIVVLPFTNMSNDTEQEYFSDGLTEEITSDLSRLGELTVISRSSSMTYKGTSKKISEIANELGVGYVLEGSVRKSDNRLRISAKLIDPLSDSYLWSEKYNVILEDIFVIQENLSRSIVEALKVNLSEKEKQSFATNDFDNIEAYDLYLRARNELQFFDPVRMERALVLTNEALEITGEHAVLFALKAYIYYNLGNMGISYHDNFQHARNWLDKSLQLDPDCLNAHLTLGLIHATDGHVNKGIEHLNKVLEINPNHFEALFWKYAIYTLNGRNEVVKDNLEYLIRIQPFSSLVTHMLPAITYFYSGMSAEAIALTREGQIKEPGGFYDMMYPLSHAVSGKGIPSIVEVPPERQSFFTTMYYIMDFLSKGKVKSAKELMTDTYCDFIKRDLSYAHWQSMIFALFDMEDETLEWLNYAIDRGFCNYPLLSSPDDPINKVLGGSGQYNVLLDKVKPMWENL